MELKVILQQGSIEELPRVQKVQGQGTKKAFTKRSKCLAKEPRRSSSRRYWTKIHGRFHQGIQALDQGAKKAFTKGFKASRRTLPSNYNLHNGTLEQGIQKDQAKEPIRLQPSDQCH